ncbi:MAG: hypothetical protein RLO81_16600 [Fulvivirga sp.]|uniref:hypothetical protein n=1 Tax=Fulvivirga sp. TaxID=1931237 RepID=UPI0032EF25AF
MKKNTLLLIFFALSQVLNAQDQIHKKDNTVIKCRVVEVGLEEIKYTEHLKNDELRISIAVDQVRKIVFETGRIIEFTDPLNDPNSYADDRKRALKFHFLSPLRENLTFSYEKNIKPGRSVETTFGVIGVGFDVDPEDNSTGIHTGIGVKFMRTPDFYSSRFKYSHILKGSYIKPQVLISAYRNEYNSYLLNSPNPTRKEKDVVALALLLNLGKQIVFDNFFLIDYSFGLGYGFTNISTGEGDVSYRSDHYGFLAGDENFPIAISFNLKVGILLK